jgi:hypothetical protein
MTNEKQNYVAVLPDGREHFEEMQPFSRKLGTTESDYRQVCFNAVRAAELTTPRHAPEAVIVELFSLHISQGKLVRCLVGRFSTMPDLERMTADEHRLELQSILQHIPAAFHSYISEQSYDAGHSSGYEECINIARAIAAALAPAIENYRQELLTLVAYRDENHETVSPAIESLVQNLTKKP